MQWLFVHIGWGVSMEQEEKKMYTIEDIARELGKTTVSRAISGKGRIGQKTRLAFIWLIPIIWLLCTSFSAYSGMNTSTFFPKNWSISAYSKLFHPDSVVQFPQWFFNTFIIACFSCVISTMFVLMVAYATSVMRFKMRKPLMNMAVILNLFPGMMAMIAVYFTLKSFNLTNSYAGLIMVYSASSGLGYLIAKGFFDTVPRALCEAARIDGCSEARIFFQMVLPMSRPIVVYTVISSFLVPWMDFVYAKMILNAGISSKYTVAIGLYKMLDKSLINNYFTQFCAGGIVVHIGSSAVDKPFALRVRTLYGSSDSGILCILYKKCAENRSWWSDQYYVCHRPAGFLRALVLQR